MTLNIKDPEAHRLAQAIAELTGEPLSRVVTGALRERYARLERRQSKATVSEILSIAAHASAQLKTPHLDHGALFYDESGQPK